VALDNEGYGGPNPPTPVAPAVRATGPTHPVNDSRIRAYFQFLFALFYFFIARALSHHAAMGLANDAWQPVASQAIFVFLLLLGYAGLGFTVNRQEHPIAAQGLPRRRGWLRETAMGMATGWGAATVCVLVMAIFGGIAVGLSFSLSAWAWLPVDISFYILLCLGEEIAFRGYGFQRFARSLGPTAAVFAFALLYAFLESILPGATRTTALNGFVLAVVLSLAYLRTRALWVSWGLNFGWKASRAIIFGLAVNGDSTHSPVVQGDPTGSFWLTGGGFGFESSWFAFFVLLALIPVVYRLTRDLDFHYNAPEIIPGGMPVDLDAAARRQHEAAMGSAEPAPPPLVQIAPVASAPPAVAPDLPSNGEPNSGNESL
jgi:uncharacterized protein